MERLNDLPTAGLWNIFQELSKIPHASGNEKAIAGWICSFAEKNGIEAFTDQAGNVILRKKSIGRMRKLTFGMHAGSHGYGGSKNSGKPS